MTSDEEAALLEAEQALQKFRSHDGCSWCKGKAEQIEAGIKELREVLPVASEMQDKLHVLAKDEVRRPLDEIRRLKDSLSTHPLVEPIVEMAKPKPFTGKLKPSLFGEGGLEQFRPRKMLKIGGDKGVLGGLGLLKRK